MYYLFFDTETTGLPSADSPAKARRGIWPDIVSIAWVLMRDDGVPVSSEYHIVYPEKWEIPPNSTEIHNISTSMARSYGHMLDEVMFRFLRDVEKADVLIAHNMRFDQNVVNNALKWRLNHERMLENYGKRMFCTMKESKDIVKIVTRTGTYKYPKLVELYRHLFGSEPKELLHNSMGDVQVMMKCFYEIWGKGLPADPDSIYNETDKVRNITRLIVSLAEGIE